MNYIIFILVVCITLPAQIHAQIGSVFFGVAGFLQRAADVIAGGVISAIRSVVGWLFPPSLNYEMDQSLYLHNRLKEMARITAEDGKKMIIEQNKIKFEHEETVEYEQGYVMSEIIERYRKMVEHVKRAIDFKSDSLFEITKRTELIQKLYFEIYHFVNMMHEIPRKYKSKPNILLNEEPVDLTQVHEGHAEMKHQAQQRKVDQRQQQREQRKEMKKILKKEEKKRKQKEKGKQDKQKHKDSSKVKANDDGTKNEEADLENGNDGKTANGDNRDSQDQGQNKGQDSGQGQGQGQGQGSGQGQEQGQDSGEGQGQGENSEKGQGPNEGHEQNQGQGQSSNDQSQNNNKRGKSTTKKPKQVTDPDRDIESDDDTGPKGKPRRTTTESTVDDSGVGDYLKRVVNRPKTVYMPWDVDYGWEIDYEWR